LFSEVEKLEENIFECLQKPKVALLILPSIVLGKTSLLLKKKNE
jgi:hypothetical protein